MNKPEMQVDQRRKSFALSESDAGNLPAGCLKNSVRS